MVKIVFMGTPDFAVPVLKQLIRDEYEIVGVVTQPDRPVGRKQIITPPPVKVTAMAYRFCNRKNCAMKRRYKKFSTSIRILLSRALTGKFYRKSY